ncbi:MAG: hypothetical protein U9R74_19750 [Pseudomonadota bacterium]|nr:hypothetical protein [Pseudomonadota bacterium]
MKPESSTASGTRRTAIEKVLFGLMIVAAIAGIAISDFSSHYGVWYWTAMVPFFGLVNLYTTATQRYLDGKKIPGFLWKPVLHWLTLLLAVMLVHVLLQAGRIDFEVAGLVALMSVAITTCLAGVHSDWRFGVVGIVLGLAVAAAAFLEEYFLILLFPSLVAGGAVLFWKRHRASD